MKKHRKQIAALPYRYVNDNIEILLITSRDSHRPVICKGWTEKKIKSHDQAAIEAFEEAGVVGRISTKSINSYTYKKIINDNCNIMIYLKLYELFTTAKYYGWNNIKVGDQIILIHLDNSDLKDGFKPYEIYKIENIQDAPYPYRISYYNGERNVYTTLNDTQFRKATPEEIEEYQQRNTETKYNL